MIERDFNFELLPSEAATDGFVFGIHQEASLDAEGFVPGSTDWATQDSEDPTNGSTLFGRDRLIGPTWNWQLHVNRTNPSEARDTLARFRTAWHALHIRDTPGAVLPLRYKMEGGDVRRIYGRPRRFEAPPNNLILSGYVPVSIDFKCVDGYTYDDQMTMVALDIGGTLEDPDADTGGGFIFPLTFPHVTLPPTRERRQLVVGGDAPTYPVIRFYGPVVSPRLVTDNWTLSLNTSIPPNQYVEVDLRPWRQTALLNGVSSVAGSLGRRQRLSKIRLMPGERPEMKYLGSTSSQSTCTIAWASTYNSL